MTSSAFDIGFRAWVSSRVSCLVPTWSANFPPALRRGAFPNSAQCRSFLLPLLGRMGRTETGAAGATAWSGPTSLLEPRAGETSPVFSGVAQ